MTSRLQTPVSVQRLKPSQLPATLIRRPGAELLHYPDTRTRLTLVTAPAGFGKTVFLGGLHARIDSSGEDVCWLRADPSDTTPARFLRVLIEALRVRRPLFGATLLGALATEWLPDPDTAAILIGNEFHAEKRPLTLLLDECERWLEPFFWRTLSALLREAPADFRLAVSARHPTPLETTRLEGEGNAVRIDLDVLAFDETQTALWLAEKGAAWNGDTRRRVTSLTAGWPALLEIALAGSRAAKNPDRYLERLHGGRGRIGSYLRTEVLREVPEQVSTLLQQTAIVPQFNQVFCNSVLGRGVGDQLCSAITRYGLPVRAVTAFPELTEFHPALQQLLEHDRGTGRRIEDREVHAKASRWLARHGMHPQAIDHAFHGTDPERAAGLLASSAEQFAERGEIDTFLRYAKLLPIDIARRHPSMRLRQAWAMTLISHFDEAREILRDIRRQLGALHPGKAEALEPELLRREMTVDLLSDNLHAAAIVATRILDTHPPQNPAVLREIGMERFYARQNLFDCADLADAEAQAALLRDDPSQSFASVWTDCIVANAERMRGALIQSSQLCQEAIAVANRHAPPEDRSTMAAMPKAILANVCYEQNRLSEAEKHATQAFAFLDGSGLLDPAIIGYQTLARLHALRKDYRAAENVLNRAAILAGRRGYRRLRNLVIAERIRISLLRGRRAEALRLAKGDDLIGAPDQRLPTSRSDTGDMMRTLAWARIATAAGETADVVRVLRRWLKVVTDCTYDLYAVQLSTQLAIALQIQGDLRPALRQIRSALETARPEGLVRSFLDEGEPVRYLLNEIWNAGQATADPVVSYAGQLLKTFAQEQPMHPSLRVAEDDQAAPAEPLTPRQLEILHLVSAGLSNREIGADLGLTEGSVKWHLHDAYNRLGVQRRSQAVRRALQLGYLHFAT